VPGSCADEEQHPRAKAPAALAGAPLAARAHMYLELSKHKLSGLVMATSAAGYVMAGPPYEAGPLAATMAGTFLASACANTLNQVYERPRDARMKRTMRRPLPSGRVSPGHALAFAGASGTAGVALLYSMADPLAAALAAGNIALYAGVYTPLKVVTPLNTAVGAVVGAMPPLMGWAAATGSIAAPEPAALAATLFLWQMPHFYALAWMYRADYAAGGYRMLPLYDPTGATTAAHSVAYAWALAAVPVACAAAGVTSPMFAVESVAFNGGLLWLAHGFRRQRTQASARRLFLYSLAHLPVMLGLMILHGTHRSEEEGDPHPGARFLDRVRAAGRAVCIHEHVKAPDACPVVIHETSPATLGRASHEKKADA